MKAIHERLLRHQQLTAKEFIERKNPEQRVSSPFVIQTQSMDKKGCRSRNTLADQNRVQGILL